MDFTYKGYQLINVYRKIDPSLRKEIIDLWTGTGTLPRNVAEERVCEVVYIIRTAAGQMAGVTSVYIHNFMSEDSFYYFMRMFIRIEDRGIYGLHSFLSRKTRLYLKTCDLDEIKTRGVIIVTENPKLWRKSGRRVLERNGWNYLGQGPKGNHIWYDNFDGSQLETGRN